MNDDKSKKVNEVTSKDEKIEEPTVRQDEELEDVIVAAEMKGGDVSVKNFFAIILRTIGGVIFGAICAVIGILLAVFLVGICLVIGILITTIYSFFMGIIVAAGTLITTIYGGLIGIIVVLATLIVVDCIGVGFFLGFTLIVSPKLVKKSFKEIFE